MKVNKVFSLFFFFNVFGLRSGEFLYIDVIICLNLARCYDRIPAISFLPRGTLKRFGKKIKELNRNLADLDDGDARANRELDAIEEDCMDLEKEAERLKATIVEVESTNIDGNVTTYITVL